MGNQRPTGWCALGWLPPASVGFASAACSGPVPCIGTPIRHLFVNWTANFAGFLSHQTDRPTRGGGGRPGATPAAGQGGRAEGRPRRFGGGHAEKTPTPFLRGQKTGLRPEISTNLQYYSMWVRIRHLGVSAVGPQGSICPRSVVLQVSKVL